MRHRSWSVATAALTAKHHQISRVYQRRWRQGENGLVGAWFLNLYHTTYTEGFECLLMMEKQLNPGPATSFTTDF